MKLRNLFIAAVTAIFALASCEEDKPTLGITVDPTEVEIEQAGGMATIKVATSQPWIVSVPQTADWIQVSPDEGEGNATITIVAGENTGKDRSATISVKAGFEMVPVSVKQTGTVASGNGSKDSPFSASEARAWIMENLADGETSDGYYYVKGKIHKMVTDKNGVDQYYANNAQYGNASFFISDDGQASDNDFEAYRVKYLGNQAWKTGDTDVAIGDEVVIYGTLKHFGNTPENGDGAFLFSLNGVDKGGDEPVNKNEPNGSGTVTDPFNVAAAINAVKDLTWTSTTDYQKVGPYFVTGKVVEIKENFDATAANGTQYGNATFYIADEGFESTTFYCYRVKYFNNQAWQAGNTPILAVGDDVVICSELMNYRGNTPETVANSGYMISINDVVGTVVDPGTGGDTTAEIKGDGSESNPFNVAAAINAVKDLTWTSSTEYGKVGPYYVKGKVKSIKENFDATASNGTQYGNATFDIVDEGYDAAFTCFRVLYFEGKAWTAGQTPLIAVGDEVVVYSELMNYRGNTPETVANKGNVIRINDATSASGGETPPVQEETATGDGTLASPYNPKAAKDVASALEAGAKTDDVYVKGKISSIKYSFDAEHGTATFFISEDGTTSGTQFQVYSTYYLGNRAWAEGDTQIALKDEVILFGKLTNFNGTPETSAKESCLYSLNGVTAGGETPPADETLTVSEILALAKGTACDSKPSLVVAITARGFVATDGRKNIYVYTQGTNFNGIAKIGDSVKFSGVKGEYSSMPQVGTITSVEVVSSGNNVSYPNPVDVTESAGTYTATEAEFISITGTLNVNGSYYNIALDAFADGSKMGSLVYPAEDLKAADYNGKKITVTGYFGGLTGSGKYINVIATKIAEAGGGETPPEPPVDETKTITEILGLDKGTTFSSKESLVVAVTTAGFVATDGTKSVYVFTQKTADFNGKVKIGDMVKFSGSKTVYNDIHEVESLTALEVVSSNNNVAYPNPTDITASAGTYTSAEAEFVSLTGTLAISGNYYNLTLDAFADGSKMGSIVYPAAELNAASYSGKKITVTGYFNGLSSKGKYINVIATKIEEVGEATLTTATASATETQISASWNSVVGAQYYQWNLYKLTDDGQLASEQYLAYGLTTHTSITSTIGRNTSASDNKDEWSVQSLANGKYALVITALAKEEGQTQATQISTKAAGFTYYFNLKVSGLQCKDGVVSASWKAYTGDDLAFYRWQLQLIKADGTRENVAMGNTTGTSISTTIGQTLQQDDYNVTAWYVAALEAGDYYFGVIACSSTGSVLEKSQGTDHFTYSGSAQNESRTIEISIADYAAANNWANGTKYTTITKDGITLTASGGGNTGKYYTSGNEWRFYQTESATLAISAGDYELVSAKIEYSSQNTGVLKSGDDNLSSGQEVAFGEGMHRASFAVGNSGSATNGQVRITKATIVIK